MERDGGGERRTSHDSLEPVQELKNRDDLQEALQLLMQQRVAVFGKHRQNEALRGAGKQRHSQHEPHHGHCKASCQGRETSGSWAAEPEGGPHTRPHCDCRSHKHHEEVPQMLQARPTALIATAALGTNLQMWHAAYDDALHIVRHWTRRV